MTVPEVLEEVRDQLSKLRLAGARLKVIEPSKRSVEEVKAKAKMTGDLANLSLTDLKLLALAKEVKGTLVTDDRNIQNVARKLGIAFSPVAKVPIKKLIVWRKFCPACKRFFQRGTRCPVCGHELEKR
jgi:UPF0271 protein